MAKVEIRDRLKITRRLAPRSSTQSEQQISYFRAPVRALSAFRAVAAEVNMANVFGRALIVLAAVLLTTGPSVAQSELEKYRAAERIANKQLSKFGELDFVVFTQQKWDRPHESHSKDILVDWPDGYQTKGIEQHIDDLKAMFVYAPDTRIETHPVKIANSPRSKEVLRPNLPANPGDHQRCMFMIWSMGIML
jgi:hypothetical protein